MPSEQRHTTPLGRESLTLTWLYQQRSLKLTEIIATDVEFCSVHPTEMPDPTEFLTPGAIVLTTGIAWATEADATDYVSRLASCGVVAIGFGSGVIYLHPPQSLITACTAHNIGLFDVPRAIPFVSIQARVHQEILQRRTVVQESLHTAQEALNSAALRGGITQLLHELASSITADAALSDAAGTLIFAPDNDRYDVAQRARRLIQEENIRTAVLNSGDVVTTTQRLSTGDSFLLLVLASATGFDARARSLIKHASGLIEILAHNHGNDSHEAEKLALGILAQHPLLTETAQHVLSTLSSLDNALQLAYIHADSPLAITKALNHLAKSTSSTTVPHTVAITLSNTSAIAVHASASESLFMQAIGPHHQLRIAFSDPLTPSDITPELVERLSVQAHNLMLGTSSTSTHHDSWFNHPEFLRLTATHRLRTIDTLDEHDCAHNSAYRATLEAFLRHNGNAAAAAQQLGIHRHTMRNHLHHIEDLCSLNLNDPVTRAELLLLLMSHGAHIKGDRRQHPTP